jgi:hypothetical protein
METQHSLTFADTVVGPMELCRTPDPSASNSVLKLVLHHALEKDGLSIRSLPVSVSNAHTVRSAVQDAGERYIPRGSVDQMLDVLTASRPVSILVIHLISSFTHDLHLGLDFVDLIQRSGLDEHDFRR